MPSFVKGGLRRIINLRSLLKEKMGEELTLKVQKNSDLSEEELENIITLCSNVFHEDYRPYMKDFIDGTHILGYYEDTLVSHVLWLNRWVRIDKTPLLRTAFLDAVAVDEKYRKRASEITEAIIDHHDELFVACSSGKKIEVITPNYAKQCEEIRKKMRELVDEYLSEFKKLN